MIRASCTGLLLISLATAQSASPVGPIKTRISRAKVLELLAGLDTALARRDLEAYFEVFTPDRHPGLRRQLRQELRGLFAAPGTVRCRSSLQALENRGSYAAARIRQEFSSGGRSFRRDAYLGLQAGPQQVQALFLIEVDSAAVQRHVAADQYRCPACNYGIRFGDDWLSVPQPASLRGCMEGHFLISLSQDVVVETAVHIRQQVVPARQALSQVLRSSRALQLRQGPEAKIRSWRPRGLRGSKASAARAETRRRDGSIAAMHLACHGRLQYLLVAHGPAAAMKRARGAVRRLLDGFRLLEPGLSPAAIAGRALAAHTGGNLSKANAYTNPRHRLTLQGPKGWTGIELARGELFEICFVDPGSGSRLHIRGVAPLQETWGQACRDHLRRRLSQGQDPSWSDFDDWCRDLYGFEHSGQTRRGPAKAQLQTLQLAAREDIILVIEADARSGAAQGQIRAAIDSLRRL